MDVNLSMEYSVTLSINGSPFIIIACSGSEMREMAVGHLLSEGIISEAEDIRAVTFDTDSLILNVETDLNDRILERMLRIRRLPSGCGQGIAGEDVPVRNVTGKTAIAVPTVLSMMREFLQHSTLHRLTHGVHSAALFTADGRRLSFFDEIGRHNAIDKVLGHALLNGIDLSDKIVASTGRVASEIILKLINASVPAIISRASPTSLSRELAIRHGVVMIGRVRASSCTVFNGIGTVTP